MSPSSTVTTFPLSQDAWGQLVYTDVNDEVHVGVVPVRAYPISAPQENISLLNQAGQEVGWIEKLTHIDDAAQALIQRALKEREFMPVIQRIVSVSSFHTPSIWRIETNAGTTELTLKGEEDIRRLPGDALLIADRHGVNFMIQDMTQLDRQSRKWLDRFL